ncbi:MAG: N-acetylmuramoyl-L-alanine amidase [Muribaculaceae bacterium]|nr:N-acetylmuramoyl-L-alanine amidase [Muribaculaceae bacterium]
MIAYASEEAEPIVVVIDPGHGGKNLGAEYEDITEKELTLTVAKAMKAELEQYEGISVYLTRTDDTGLSLEERCEYAAKLNADFLFCLHFNMSEYHTLFGAETWVSAFGDMYARGYAFAEIEMELLENMGLYSRGIKTRLNDDGEDYYGIIRHATERNLPCVLIEHCHLDQDNDKPFYDRQEKLEAFGRLDAEAVARYYGLRSESLGTDFSDYPRHETEAPAYVMRPDFTKPDVCLIEEVGKNEKKGEVTLRLSAADYDSGMLYYAYSYDGGMTFSELQKWPDKSVDTFELTLTIPSGIIPQIVINAYNGYDLYTTSNLLSLPSMNAPTDKEKAENPDTDPALEKDTADPVIKSGNASGSMQTHDEEEEETPLGVFDFLKLCLLCAFLVFTLVFSVYLTLRNYKRKRRRRRKHK